MSMEVGCVLGRAATSEASSPPRFPGVDLLILMWMVQVEVQLLHTYAYTSEK